jgi:putative oxidoreductase
MLSDLGLLVLRFIVGGIFVAHGYPKLFGGPGKQVSPSVARYLGQGFVQAMERGGPAGFAPGIERFGLPEPLAWAWFVASLEFFGGIMLAIGWLTRVVAILLAGEMVVAISRVHWRNGLMGPGSFEFPLSLLGACLALVGTGPGRISVDGVSDPYSGE